MENKRKQLEIATSVRLLARAVALSASGEARRIRQRSGVPLVPLARAVGSTPPTISRWERGLSRPHGDVAIRWVQVLDELAGVGSGGA